MLLLGSFFSLSLLFLAADGMTFADPLAGMYSRTERNYFCAKWMVSPSS